MGHISYKQFRSAPISKIVRVERIVKIARDRKQKDNLAKLRYDESSL